MFLVKLIKVPIKLFKKDVISFLRIRRYDLNIIDDKLHYIAVGPNASISVLREKVWHLLNLPDFCEEIIILKSNDDQVIPLTNMRKGNDPQHSFILEVWPPANKYIMSNTVINKVMLTIENREDQDGTDTVLETKQYEGSEHLRSLNYCPSLISNETVPLNKLRYNSDKPPLRNMLSDFKKSDVSCNISTTSIFRLNRRKNHDNVTNILMKIQSDLNTLSTKLCTLESRITT